jgi:hypothetical protein
MRPQRIRLLVLVLPAFVLGAVVSLFTGASVDAQAPETANIIGGWRLSFGPDTQPEDFATIIFSEGGTVAVLGGDGDRSQGVWIRTARRTFAATLDEFDIHNDGTLDRIRIRATVVLSDRDNFTGTITIDGMSPDGSTVVVNGGTFAFEGTRMIVVPE